MAHKHRPKGQTNAADPYYFSDRLTRKLDQLRASPVAIIEAPSGYGKTTAVREYLQANLPQSAEVYLFTAVDEAPVAGYGRLCREIKKIDSRAGERLHKTGFPNVFTVGETCEALRSIECNREAWLVIDNFQFVCPGLPPAFLAALLEHGGTALHVVVVTQMLGREFHTSIACRGFTHITASDLRLDADDIRRYYALSGADISNEEAGKVLSYTDGWVIAVSLQLCAYKETGAFSDAAVLSLMEKLVWNGLTDEQQIFFLRLSPFETATVRQMCRLLDCDVLPDYARHALASPFIRYDAEQRWYEPHSILFELVTQKRAERGAAFERVCLLRAGDLCRDEGRTQEALGFYSRVQEYRQMLSLDLSHLLFAEIGDTSFFAIALDIAQRCPAELRCEYPLSMLRVAWALKASGKDREFSALLDELDAQLDQLGPLRAEWLLLAAYRNFPHVEVMLPIVQKAAPLFAGACSQVILPEAPWAFGGYFQLSEFHLATGEADKEADALEAFVASYSRLTNGHGSGADALFRTELAYLRGDIASAEVFAYKAAFLAESKDQSIIQLGSAMMLANIALLKADTSGWQHAVASMERAASYATHDTLVVRPLLDIVRGSLLAELKAQTHIADWLKNGDFFNRMAGNMLGPGFANARYVHLIFLLQQGEFARLTGRLEAMPPEIRKKSVGVEFVVLLLLSVGYTLTGQREKAAELLERSAEQALPDGLLMHFAASFLPLQGLIEELLEKKYPQHLAAFNAIKAQFENGWETLHGSMFGGELPTNLSAREREIALLAADGLRNNEIGQRLFIAESTVRAHLRRIFQKLDVDRRAKLAEKLSQG